MERMEKILILDFGGQYSQLIARRVREQHVYAEIEPFCRFDPDGIRGGECRGIILTGGPDSVYAADAPRCGAELLRTGVPVLGICYGFQLLADLAGGTVEKAETGEYGKTLLRTDGSSLFSGMPGESICWMSHRDAVKCLPPGFSVTARTADCPIAAFSCEAQKLYGVQFHPEVMHTEYGTEVLRNFLFGICGCSGDWRMGDWIERTVSRYRNELKGKRTVLALSGGVDSSVAAALLHRAIGQDLVCVFVDHGLLRMNEGDLVEQTFRDRIGLPLIRVNAAGRFLAALEGVTEPEQKRRIIGENFIRVFEETASRAGDIRVLAQGTIYPDVIESGAAGTAVIKSHHNVGGLPERMDFDQIVEPLRFLFKDEVREVGERLGLPKQLLRRQPFPGPGLAVRILGEVTEERLALLRKADAIFTEELEREDRSLADQYFAVLTDTRSVGVQGDSRTYGCTVALRAVRTGDFMTAEWARLPYDLLERASSRITNEVNGITRVVYDITAKPPATVEWE